MILLWRLNCNISPRRELLLTQENIMNTKRNPAHQSRSRRSTSGYRNAWYEAPSPDSTLPEEFFDFRVNLAEVCPERALMYAVLENAFLCLQKQSEANQHFARDVREAEKWFSSDDSRWIFSFLPICDSLGIDPGYLRKKLKHWRPAGLDMAQANR